MEATTMRRHLKVRGPDRSKKGASCVVHIRDDVTVTLRVGSPEHDNTMKLVLGFEAMDVGTDVLEMNLLVISGNNVVSAGLLVCGNEVGVMGRRKRRAEESYVWPHLALRIIVEYASTFHGLVHVHA